MADGTSTGERKPHWMAVALVFGLGWLLLYSTRTALSSALKEIGDFWGLSQSYLGLLSSSFFVSYAAMHIPGGMLSDRLGPRRTIALGFFVQALGLFFGTVAQNPTQFLLARSLTGVGQAAFFSCQLSILAETLPETRRTSGNAVTAAGAGIGTAAGFLLGRFLSGSKMGWRTPFVVLGVCSIAYVVLLQRVVPEVRSRPRGDAGGDGRYGPEFTPHMVLLALVHFLTMYGFYLMLTWLPYYLETVRGFGSKMSAVVPVAMPLVMAPAAILWGMVADRLRDKRRVLFVTLPVAAIATASVPAARSPLTLAIILAIYGLAGKFVIDPVLSALLAHTTTPGRRGATLAAFNLAGALAMIAAPAVTGAMAESLGSFDLSFYVAGALNLVALLALVVAGAMGVLRPGSPVPRQEVRP